MDLSENGVKYFRFITEKKSDMALFWHVTESKNRASISRQGLIPAYPASPEQVAGVYGFQAATAADAWEFFMWDYSFPGESYDVWLIDTDRLTSPLETDPAWSGEAAFVTQRVPASIIVLAATYSG